MKPRIKIVHLPKTGDYGRARLYVGVGRPDEAVYPIMHRADRMPLWGEVRRAIKRWEKGAYQ